MSLLDPIVPYLGPLGPALAVSGTLVVFLGLIGIVSFMLYKVKRDIFATIYHFNIPPLKKHKWLISIPLSVPIAIVSNLFFPLVENGISSTPPLVFIEIAFLAPLGAIYSSFVYERAVLHM